MRDVSPECQFRLFPEGVDERGPALCPSERSPSLLGKVLPVPRTEVGEGVPFEVPPDVLGGVQFGGVGRESGQAQSIADCGQEVSDVATAVSGQAIPDHQEFAADLAQEATEEVNHLRRPDRPRIEPEVELPPRHARDHGQLTPVEVEGQLRRLAPRRPGPGNRGPFTQSAFVNKHDSSAFVAGLFFNAGQVCRFQRAMASSSRSWALPLGRWQLQPNRPNTRQRCAG